MHHLFILALVTTVAVPSAASAAFTAIGEPCSLTLNQPATDLSHFTSFREAAKKGLELVEAQAEDEASAQKELCYGSCVPWKPVAYMDLTAIHLVIPDDKGGVWVVRDIGWVGGSSACNMGEPWTDKVADGVFRIAVDEKEGEAGGDEEGNYCGNASYASSVLVLDLDTKRYLLRAVAMKDTDLVEVSATGVRAKVCGDKLAVGSFDDLRAGKLKITQPKAVSADVNRGRKLTAKKDYKGAVAAFDAALAIDPLAAKAHSGRGYAKLLAGELDGAKADFERAMKLGGTSKYRAQVAYNLAIIAEKQGRKDDARTYFEASHKLRPTKGTRAKVDTPTKR